MIADIGSGTGYFARRFAHHAARVYAVDTGPKLLEMPRKDAPANLEPRAVLSEAPQGAQARWPDDRRVQGGGI